MDAPIRDVSWRGHHPDICTWLGCDHSYYATGLCQMHYMRKYAGITMDGPPRKNPRVPGVTKRESPFGYVELWMPDHPNAFNNGWMFEHRHVMEQKIGRHLFGFESVHHRNGDRADNRIENLELWAKTHPNGQRVSDLVAHAHYILDLYGELVD